MTRRWFPQLEGEEEEQDQDLHPGGECADWWPPSWSPRDTDPHRRLQFCGQSEIPNLANKAKKLTTHTHKHTQGRRGHVCFLFK